MIVQLPDGSLWQDDGTGNFTQIASSPDDPAASSIDLGTVEQADAIVDGQPVFPTTPAPGTFTIGQTYISPEQIAYNAAVAASPAASVDTATLTVAPPPPPLTDATTIDTRTLQQADVPGRASSFSFFGQTWRYGDLVDFKEALASHGDSYATWAKEHPTANLILTVGVNPLATAQAQVAASPSVFTQTPRPDSPSIPAADVPPLFPTGYVLPPIFPSSGGTATGTATGTQAPSPPGESAPAPGSPTGIPSGVLDHRNLERVWVLAGGPTEHADVAAAIAQAESGGNPLAIDNTAYPDRPGYHKPDKPADAEWSVGLWQINLLAHPSYLTLDMEQPLPNGQAAVTISHDGSDFGAWSTYTDGAYKQFLEGAPPPGGFEATPGTAPAAKVAPPAGVQASWGDLIDFTATTVPKRRAAVSSLASSLIEVFQ